jgi:hypothetical protein
LQSDQVFFHSREHVNELLLVQLLKVLLLVYVLDVSISIVGLEVRAVRLFFDKALFFADLLYSFL